MQFKIGHHQTLNEIQISCQVNQSLQIPHMTGRSSVMLIIISKSSATCTMEWNMEWNME